MPPDPIILLDVQAPGVDRATRAAAPTKLWTVGRGDSATLCLQDPSASSEHAHIDWTERPPRVRDAGSRHGTFLYERRLGEAWTTWPEGVELWCGSTALVWRLPPEGSDDETTPLQASPSLEAFASVALLRPEEPGGASGASADSSASPPATAHRPVSADGAEAPATVPAPTSEPPRAAPAFLRMRALALLAVVFVLVVWTLLFLH